MSIATLHNAVRTDSVPPFMICEYSFDGIEADSTATELVEIELPSRTLSRYSHRHIPNVTTSGEAYAINLIGISISCNSTNLDYSILNINDITRINTINEVLSYTEIDRAESDQSFDEFIIRNRDNVLINKVYFYMINNDLIMPTGTIRLELTYVVVQDREF